jgi:hypothetical protein
MTNTAIEYPTTKNNGTRQERLTIIHNRPMTKEQIDDRFVKIKRSISYYKHSYKTFYTYMYRQLRDNEAYFESHQFLTDIQKLNRIRETYNSVANI